MGVKCLLVGDKPSIAKAIAGALAPGGNYRDKQGRQSVHYWNGTFKGQSAEFRCTSVRGHVFDCDFPEKFNDWNRVDPAHLYQVNFKRNPFLVFGTFAEISFQKKKNKKK